MLTQAVAVVAWWVWLWISPEARARFAPAGEDTGLMAFAPGDLAFLAVLPLVIVFGVRRGAWWAPYALWCHAGACWYATVWAVTLAAREPTTWLGACMMVPLAVVATSIASWWTRHATKGER